MHSRNEAQVLAFSGSLRRASFNTSLLRAMAARAPKDISISIYPDLGAIPLFNEDLEADGGPESVTRIRTAIAKADAILIATPEYNQSLPGVVKNLVDWLSRSDPEVLAGKPVALVGATVGSWGTRLAQAALRQTLTACGALIMPAPQVYLRNAGTLFDLEGSLTDEPTGAQLTRFIESFRQWISAMRPMQAMGDAR
jgi:chromate reductase, NAD(P)H dehydrogenase (quinone)